MSEKGETTMEIFSLAIDFPLNIIKLLVLLYSVTYLFSC